MFLLVFVSSHSDKVGLLRQIGATPAKIVALLVAGEHSAVVDRCHAHHFLHAPLEGTYVADARLLCHGGDAPLGLVT